MLWTSKTTVDDLRAIAELHDASWQHEYLSVLPAEFFSSSSVDGRDIQWMRMLADPAPRSSYEVLKRDGHIIGGVGWGPCNGAASGREDTGEIYGLYLRPNEWGKGLGCKLIDNALKGLRKTGFSEARVWVPEQSHRTRHLYERLQFELERTPKRVGEDNGKMFMLVCYRRAL